MRFLFLYSHLDYGPCSLFNNLRSTRLASSLCLFCLLLASCGTPPVAGPSQQGPLTLAGPPPATGVSTVILRVKGLPDTSSASRLFDKQVLYVVNLDHNAAHTWRFVEAGWVVANVLPGRYLATKYQVKTEAHTLLASSWGTREVPIRCELAVPEANAALFFGTLDLSGGVATLRDGDLEEARAFYRRFAPNSPRRLTVGEIKKTL